MGGECKQILEGSTDGKAMCHMVVESTTKTSQETSISVESHVPRIYDMARNGDWIKRSLNLGDSTKKKVEKFETWCYQGRRELERVLGMEKSRRKEIHMTIYAVESDKHMQKSKVYTWN